MYFVIHNTTQNKKLLCRLANSFGYTRESIVDAFTLPESDEDETELTRLEGVSGRIEMSWTMKDSSEDVSMGTQPGGVYTIEQQFTYAGGVVVTPYFDDEWTVTLYDSNNNVIDSWSGAFEKFHVTIDVGARTLRADASFVIGTVV